MIHPALAGGKQVSSYARLVLSRHRLDGQNVTPIPSALPASSEQVSLGQIPSRGVHSLFLRALARLRLIRPILVLLLGS